MPESLFHEYLPSTLAGIVALGIGVIFFLIEQRSATSVVLSASYVCVGLALALNPPLVNGVGDDGATSVERCSGIFEAAAVIFFAQWLRRVAATAQTTDSARARVTLAVWALHLLALAYLLLGIALPRERLDDYLFSLADSGALTRPGFWVFAGVWILIADFFLLAWITLVFQRLDEAERVRATATVVGTPFAISATALPLGLAELSLTLALLIWLVGFFRYFVIQGERGAFMSRFLSPQVSELVRLQGLASVMDPRSLQITAVSCDLRGFTAYAEAHSSDHVIRLLSTYYECVGELVGEVGGTVKDYAGDGILILVGAPLPRPDHAGAGLALARRISDEVGAIMRSWSTPDRRLGVGVGVASGAVTVGALGSSSRMEYTAVGTAVNLAARLCSAAGDGQALVDQATVELAGVEGLERRGEMQIKGLSAGHLVYVLDHGSPREPGRLSEAPGSTSS